MLPWPCCVGTERVAAALRCADQRPTGCPSLDRAGSRTRPGRFSKLPGASCMTTVWLVAGLWCVLFPVSRSSGGWAGGGRGPGSGAPCWLAAEGSSARAPVPEEGRLEATRGALTGGREAGPALVHLDFVWGASREGGQGSHGPSSCPGLSPISHCRKGKGGGLGGLADQRESTGFVTEESSREGGKGLKYGVNASVSHALRS